jgi:hypothetical protein
MQLMIRLSALGLLAGAAMVSTPVQAERIRCESSNGNYRSCAADTRYGVTLVRQLSQQGCWRNDTWGADRNRIWVNHGCRAEFETGGGSAGGGSHSNDDSGKVVGALILGAIAGAVIANQRDDDRDHHGYPPSRRSFTCESDRDRFRYCGVRVGRRDHVEVQRQLSQSPCRAGSSWGFDRARGEVWVDRGCRAEFVVY